MTLRADHIAGAFFVAFGCLVLALSGDLPVGTLSLPGAGFLPELIAGLTIVFGIALIVRAGESAPFADLEWSDLRHAAPVMVITGAAIYAYEWLGFNLTMGLMVLALLLIVERRRPLRAAIYTVAVVAGTYVVFAYGLKTPMPTGPLGF